MSLFKKNNNQNKKKTPGRFRLWLNRFSNYTRFFTIFVLYTALTIIIGVMLYARISNNDDFRIVEKGIATAVGPVQNTFSNIVNVIVNDLRKIKLRSNIEKEYNKLLAENEQLVYDAMLANELKIQISQYNSLFDEVSLNESMNPVACKVIGRDNSNYFSVFTINKGSSSGIEDFMAVTSNGALIGYTYNVSLNKSNVRTIIDSEASIAALIQSSRDQGTIRGTLGINGEPMCRMYYLPNDNLPRPGDEVVTSGVGMSFPRGIPIGTVRESTRGMEENKQFIVVEPKNDFRHVENVIVLRYKPDPIGVGFNSENKDQTIYDNLPGTVPVPTLLIGKDEYVISATPTPNLNVDVDDKNVDNNENNNENDTLSTNAPENKEVNGGLEYNIPHSSVTPEIKFSVGPTSTPAPTEPPLNITIED